MPALGAQAVVLISEEDSLDPELDNVMLAADPYAGVADLTGSMAGDSARALAAALLLGRETAEPQNAFYQQGEMANEAARVCIDAGDLAAAAGAGVGCIAAIAAAFSAGDPSARSSHSPGHW